MTQSPLLGVAEFAQALRDVAQRRWRLPLWWQAPATDAALIFQQQVPALLQQYQQIAGLRQVRALWLGNKPEHQQLCTLALPTDWSWTTLQGQARQQALGRECDVLVLDVTGGIDWDLVAATCGTVRAGGLWLLISPPDLASLSNPVAKKVVSWPIDAQQHVGFFQAFVQQQLSQAPLWLCRASGSGAQLQPSNAWLDWLQRHAAAQMSAAPAAALEPANPTVPGALLIAPQTDEQSQAIAAIVRVVTGHRRRPLVLTAHRGRGKSASLGLAAASLQLAGKTQLLISGPNPAAADVALTTAQAALGDQVSMLRFVPVDVLLNTKLPCDLLLIDEAAAIPTPQLQQLTQRYSRIVFASTEHGYEGTGRGFQLRFQQYLQQHTPGWRQLQLHQPIRFGVADPLEQLSFACFLLAPTTAEFSITGDAPLTYRWLEPAQLCADTQQLHAVFSLLVLAHYQTSVRDLWALLTDPTLKIAALFHGSHLIACSVICVEGEFTPVLAQQIANGQRRVQGHLLAQSLAYHLLQPTLAQQQWWRIQRIVVQPELQGQGFGSSLLQWLQHEATQHQASLGTSFGAHAQLVHFWQRHGFCPVRLSTQADQASAEYPLLMIQPSTFISKETVRELQHEFAQQLYLQLPQLPKLDPSLIQQWVEPQVPPLTPLQQRQLLAYARGHKPIHEVKTLLPLWLAIHIRHLAPTAALPLIRWLWLQSDDTDNQSGHAEYLALSRNCIQMIYVNNSISAVL